MLTLVNLLIIFFIILIFYQIFLAYFEKSIIEGYENENNKEYKAYDTNSPDNALILAQQNAGNIEVLKGQLDNMLGINKQVQDLSGNVSLLQDQVNNLVVSQNAYASSTIPSTAPDISGTTDDSTTNDSTMTN